MIRAYGIPPLGIAVNPASKPGRRRLSTLFALLVIAPLLSGCFTVEQEIWVNPDGTGRLHLDIGIPSTGGEPGSSGIPESEIVEDLRQAARPLVGDPRLRNNPVVSWYSRDGYDHAELELTAVDWRLLPTLATEIIERGTRRVPGSHAWARLLAFSLEEDSEGLIWYSQPPAPLSAFHAPGTEDRLVEAFGAGAWQEFIDGTALTVILHSPTISSTNGRWMSDKVSVRFATDLREIVRGRTGAAGFTARIGASARSTHFLRTLLIITAVSLLVLTLTLLSRRRHRRQSELAQPPR